MWVKVELLVRGIDLDVAVKEAACAGKHIFYQHLFACHNPELLVFGQVNPFDLARDDNLIQWQGFQLGGSLWHSIGSMWNRSRVSIQRFQH